MIPTSKCLDVGDHICAVVYTTSYHVCTTSSWWVTFSIPPVPRSDMMIVALANSGKASCIYEAVQPKLSFC